MSTLLAVDVGLRTGLALYGDDGRLRWYRSHNFGTRGRLRRAVPSIIGSEPDLAWMVTEGGTLSECWTNAAHKSTIGVLQLSAEQWRQEFLHAREQRNAATAKETANILARRIITWSEAAEPTSLRHDAAEAILIGLWGVIQIGWLDGPPAALRTAA